MVAGLGVTFSLLSLVRKAKGSGVLMFIFNFFFKVFLKCGVLVNRGVLGGFGRGDFLQRSFFLLGVFFFFWGEVGWLGKRGGLGRGIPPFLPFFLSHNMVN